MQCLGFGKGLKPFGKGAPSEGWPSDLDWTDFKGPKRFCDIKKGTIVIKIVLRGPGNHFFLRYGPERQDQEAEDYFTTGGNEKEDSFEDIELDQPAEIEN